MPQAESPASILVIRRDNIGDLVCTTPLLAALRARFPRAWIGVLANSYNAPVLAGNPDVDAVYAYTKLKHRPPGSSRAGILWQRLAMVAELRRRRIDDVILGADGEQASARRFAAWIAPRRIIAADSRPPTGTHEVERCFARAAVYGIADAPPPCRIVPTPQSEEAARRRLPEALRGRPLVGLHISARKAPQRWPLANFAALADALHKRHGYGFLLFWSPGASGDPLHPGDDAQAAELLARTAHLPIAPMPTAHLAELIAGLSLCERVVCSDGGAMHVAAALGKPIVCFFGNSDAARWHPWGVPYELLQKDSRDAADIGVEEAETAFERLLARGG